MLDNFLTKQCKRQIAFDFGSGAICGCEAVLPSVASDSTKF